MRHKRKLLLIAAAIASSCVVGGWAYLRRQQRVEYRTVAVARGSINSAISATGNPNAVVTVQVGSQVSGNIMALYADFNSKVKAGQLIAPIEPQIFKARVDAAQAAVGSARAAVYNAQANVQKSVADIANAQANVLV